MVLTATEQLHDIAPYGRRHGETLSPEQKDIIAPAMELCERVLEEGETVILLGSRALAPYIIPYLTDPDAHRVYLEQISKKDFDLHSSRTSISKKLEEELTETGKSYTYGFRGQSGEYVFDVVDNESLSQKYLAGIRQAIQLAEDSGVNVTTSRIWLKHLETGENEYVIPLTRIYAPSTVGTRLVKRNGKIEVEVFDPLGFLETINEQVETSAPINPHSARFYLLENITVDTPDPYDNGIRDIPVILQEPKLKEIAHSALGELPSIAKMLVTHHATVSSPYVQTIYTAMRKLARLDPEYAITENNYIKRYAEKARAMLGDNLDNFMEIIQLMLYELPLGWCIYPEDWNTNSHIRNRVVRINSNVSGVNTETLERIKILVEKNGNPKSLSQALAMYLTAERGKRDPSTRLDPIETARHASRIVAWWNNPDVTEEEVIRYFNYYNATLFDQEQ